MKNKMTSREIGDIGEDFTAQFLIKKGCEILERNFTVRGGEIDIIAKKGKLIHFVEVKSRKHNPLSSGQEALTKTKVSRIIKAAHEYISRNDVDISAVYDAAIVEISDGVVTGFDYIQSAFTESN
jgi:UPF0102 protein DICTH_1420